MRKIDWPFAFAATALATILIAIVFEDYPRYADCSQQQANSDGLCHLPWWDYSGAWVAIFTIVLTVSTALLWWTTREALRHAQTDSDRQSRETREQIELATKQFNATFRPKLILHRINIAIDAEIGEVVAIATVLNVGSSNALVTFPKLTIAIRGWSSVKWDEPGIIFKPVTRPGTPLKSGVAATFGIKASFTPMQIAQFKGLGSRLYVAGDIGYFDENGGFRSLGFIRWYDTQFERFEKLPLEWAGSEMEYEY